MRLQKCMFFFFALFLVCALTAAETPIVLSFSFEKGGAVIEGRVLQKRRIPGANLKCRVTAVDKELPQSAENNILLGEWALPGNGELLVFRKETAQLPERRLQQGWYFLRMMETSFRLRKGPG